MTFSIREYRFFIFIAPLCFLNSPYCYLFWFVGVFKTKKKPFKVSIWFLISLKNIRWWKAVNNSQQEMQVFNFLYNYHIQFFFIIINKILIPNSYSFRFITEFLITKQTIISNVWFCFITYLKCRR